MNFSLGFTTIFVKVSKIRKTCKTLTNSLYYTELFPAANTCDCGHLDKGKRLMFIFKHKRGKKMGPPLERVKIYLTRRLCSQLIAE